MRGGRRHGHTAGAALWLLAAAGRRSPEHKAQRALGPRREAPCAVVVLGPRREAPCAVVVLGPRREAPCAVLRGERHRVRWSWATIFDVGIRAAPRRRARRPRASRSPGSAASRSRASRRGLRRRVPIHFVGEGVWGACGGGGAARVRACGGCDGGGGAACVRACGGCDGAADRGGVRRRAACSPGRGARVSRTWMSLRKM